MRRHAISGALALFTILLPMLMAAESAVLWQSRVSRIALFKNGLGFFVREGNLPPGTVIQMGPYAAATHGTFWVNYPEKVQLASIVGRETTITEQEPVTSLAELLRANVGRDVVLQPSGDPVPIRGKLLSVATEPELPRADVYGWGRNPDQGAYNRLSAQVIARLALIQTENGVVGIDPAILRQVTVTGGSPATTWTRGSTAWQLEAHLAQSSPGQPLAASYLAKGITWAPSYMVDMSKPKLASITAKAEILNEAEPLTGVHVDLVTGYPNLRFSEIVSPLAGKDTLAGFLRALLKGETAGRPQSALMNQIADYRATEGSTLMPDYGAPVAGTTVEDLFFYPLERVTLAKGEVGYFPLFTTTAPYTAVHQWDIPDYVNEEDRYGDQRRERPDTQEEVWHALKLSNGGKLPWTSAPAQVVKDEQLLGQDMLAYTPAGGETLLRITRAMSVKADQMELETNRQRDAVQMYGYSFDRVTVQGRLQVANHKSEPITLEITKHLSGEVKATSPQVGIAHLAKGLRRMNPSQLLTWSLELQADQRQEVTYTYEALIRR